MTEKLKPCPFCGGEGRVFEDTSFGVDNPLYRVFCGMCLVKTDTAYRREDAIEIWNRRANDD